MKIAQSPLLLILILIFSTNSHAGTEGHGGDEIALDFLTSLSQGVEEASRRSEATRSQLEAAGIPALASTIKVVVRDEPLFVVHEGNTQESIAVNYRDSNLIEINRARWKALATPRLKQAIALHEALSLKSLEQTGYYPISGPYAASFGYKDAAIRTGNLPDSASAQLGTDFSTQKCTQLTTITNNADKQRYVVQGDHGGGTKVWRQGNLEFSLQFNDTNFDLLGPRTSIQLSRMEVLDRNAKKQIMRSKSKSILFAVRGSKVDTIEQTMDRTVEDVNAEESLHRLLMGNDPEPKLVRTIQRDLGNKQTLFVQRNEQAENNKETNMLVESHVVSCIELAREPEELKTLAAPAIHKAVEAFDKKIQAVTLAEAALELCRPNVNSCELEKKSLETAVAARDSSWPKMIDPKVFLPKPKPAPRKRSAPPGDRTRGGHPNYGEPNLSTPYYRPEPFPATDLRDRYGRPVYKDRFGTYKDASGFPINPWNIKEEVRDKYGRSVCEDFFNRPMFGCRD